MNNDDEEMPLGKWLNTREGVAHQIWHECAKAVTETIWAMSGALLADGLICDDSGQWYVPTVARVPSTDLWRWDRESRMSGPGLDAQTVLDYWNAHDIFPTVAAIVTKGQSAEIQRIRFTLPIVEQLLRQGRFQAARAYERSVNVNIKLYCNAFSTGIYQTNNFDRYLAALFDTPEAASIGKGDRRQYVVNGIYAPMPGRISWPALTSPFTSSKVIPIEMLKPHGPQFSPYMPLSDEQLASGSLLSASDGFPDVPKPSAETDLTIASPSPSPSPSDFNPDPNEPEF